MQDNPYDPPTSSMADSMDHSSKPKMSDDTREMLGIAKDDFWAYPAILMLIVGCFVSNPWLVALLFAWSSAFLSIYLVKSFPKYTGHSNLKRFTKRFGFIMNILSIVVQVVVILAKSIYLLRLA